MGILEAEEAIFRQIQKRVLLTRDRNVNIALGDISSEDFTVSEVVCVIERAARDGLLNILGVTEAKNHQQPAIFVLSRLFQKVEYDLKKLSNNRLGASHIVSLRVNPIIVDSYRISDDEERALFVKLTNQHLEIAFPLKLSCPLCRSGLIEIADQNSWEARQEDFANGKFVKCKDRRHPTSFYYRDGRIIIQTSLIGSIPKTEVDEKR